MKVSRLVVKWNDNRMTTLFGLIRLLCDHCDGDADGGRTRSKKEGKKNHQSRPVMVWLSMTYSWESVAIAFFTPVHFSVRQETSPEACPKNKESLNDFSNPTTELNQLAWEKILDKLSFGGDFS